MVTAPVSKIEAEERLSSIVKHAYSIQMSSDISDDDRLAAKSAEDGFSMVLAQVRKASEHLDYIYIPFSKLDVLDSDVVVDNRVSLRRYRNQIHKNFEDIFKASYLSVAQMSRFSTDGAVEELMRSYISDVRDLEKSVNYLLSVFSSLNSSEFKDSLLESIMGVKKQCAKIKQLINDRVLEYISTNILAENWENLVSDKVDVNIANKSPLLVELYNSRV